jgi:hypothetical protein
MWIFTTDGFISAVAHREQPGKVLVRARRSEHLRALFPDVEIECNPHADYRYRTVVERSYWLAKVLAHASMIDYCNFKGAIPDAEYHDACTAVWAEMHKLQPGSNPYKGGRMSPYNHY